MQKQQLRARMKALRAACEDRRARDNGIFENLFSQPFMNAETFFVYVSFGSEADTRRIIEELFKRGKTVFLPRVAGQRMQCVRYVGQALEKGAFGILCGGITGAAAGITAVMLFSLLAALVVKSHRK